MPPVQLRHRVGTGAPLAVLYVPAAHCVQVAIVVAPDAVLYKPGAHSKHCAELVAPVDVRYVPVQSLRYSPVQSEREGIALGGRGFTSGAIKARRSNVSPQRAAVCPDATRCERV